ncbi:MAG: hypothetical protein ACLP01_16700 [Solirubrobacteraceae bacterium]
MATNMIERRVVTLTIPAEHIDAFRVAVLTDLRSETDGFRHEHEHMLHTLDARDEHEQVRRNARIDRDSRIEGIHRTYGLLSQLPDEDVEAAITGDANTLRFVLEAMGQALLEPLRGLYDYCPVPMEDVTPLVERSGRLSNAAAIGEGE